jgi:chromosome segregation ATPase
MNDVKEMLLGARERKLTELEEIQRLSLKVKELQQQISRMQMQIDTQAMTIKNYQTEYDKNERQKEKVNASGKT